MRRGQGRGSLKVPEVICIHECKHVKIHRTSDLDLCTLLHVCCTKTKHQETKPSKLRVKKKKKEKSLVGGKRAELEA